MPNGTYGGVRGKETKIGRKTFVSLPTRFSLVPFSRFNKLLDLGASVPQEGTYIILFISYLYKNTLLKNQIISVLLCEAVIFIM